MPAPPPAEERAATRPDSTSSAVILRGVDRGPVIASCLWGQSALRLSVRGGTGSGASWRRLMVAEEARWAKIALTVLSDKVKELI